MPAFPQALEHVWLSFMDLAGTRDVGLSLGPITFAEIDAFRRLTQADLSAWDVKLIRRLDIAVRIATAPANANQTVDANDGAAVRSLLGGRTVSRSERRARRGVQEAR